MPSESFLLIDDSTAERTFAQTALEVPALGLLLWIAGLLEGLGHHLEATDHAVAMEATVVQFDLLSKVGLLILEVLSAEELAVGVAQAPPVACAADRRHGSDRRSGHLHPARRRILRVPDSLDVDVP